eukprot:5518179-Pleurochrysis_carterae.AAC.1
MTHSEPKVVWKKIRVRGVKQDNLRKGRAPMRGIQIIGACTPSPVHVLLVEVLPSAAFPPTSSPAPARPPPSPAAPHSTGESQAPPPPPSRALPFKPAESSQPSMQHLSWISESKQAQ